MKELLLAACLLALAAAASATDTAASAESDAKRGAALYQVYCTQCHGLKGNGGGINAAHMAVAPRDHTDRGEMSARTDEELFKVIKHGGKSINKSVLMPAWGRNLSDEDIHALVSHLRNLCCRKN
jgi:cytochrome c oxidase cbb3-type subunit 3